MSGTGTSGFPYLDSGDGPDIAGLSQSQSSWADLRFTDTGWVTCGAGNVNVTGTAKVRRIGIQVFGQFNMAYTGGWPNSQITAFTLPDTSYSPATTHRMDIGAAIQSTAGSLILIANPAANAVFMGSNGGAGSSGLTWCGPLWVVS